MLKWNHNQHELIMCYFLLWFIVKVMIFYSTNSENQIVFIYLKSKFSLFREMKIKPEIFPCFLFDEWQIIKMKISWNSFYLLLMFATDFYQYYKKGMKMKHKLLHCMFRKRREWKIIMSFLFFNFGSIFQ